ncbi:cysteine--tRNA ligase [Galbitalea sp. SE-J8]|uniref:cysteine--tRNA ligase n=1 Tax=Galbitalea sp. SE-J8 TaxID=3054952 RepID=UPI00259D24DA|nr:cysteine--tRNA ligase [Galbitalea sp. SE-J8]MDM4763754.1 cysteine--tRNA ligase [Galbitalea sp. SE-J8]
MTIRLYDSREQRVVDFSPRVPGRVGMYVCGPTVQSSPHVGHVRSALVYDLWRRWFGYRGLDVTLVRNVTDIDDKILLNATSEPYWALAYRVELEFTAAYSAIGVLPPSYEPRATASIPQMIELIGRLIAGGHAYPAPDGSGDVYFDVLSWPDYGSLTHQSVDAMEAAADADPRGKRDSRDFALWKGRKPEENADAAWASPWGEGRPGWHIECSAMSRRYLGDAFDIHGGGLDLRFPHHENELAQSAAAGLAFATHWVHNGLVTVDGQKMSKSLGNSIFAADFLALAEPVVVRYYLASAHYRSTIDYHDGALEEAAAAVGRIRSFLERAERIAERGAIVEVVPDAFGAAMDDDLGVPAALGVLHETVRAGNAAIDADDARAASVALGQVLAMTGVLGLDLAPRADAGAASIALASLVARLLDDRTAARAAKDYGTADRIRDELVLAGIALEDGADGTTWRIGS